MLYLHPFSKVTLVKGVLCIVNGIEMLCGEFRKDRPEFGEKKSMEDGDVLPSAF